MNIVFLESKKRGGLHFPTYPGNVTCATFLIYQVNSRTDIPIEGTLITISLHNARPAGYHGVE